MIETRDAKSGIVRHEISTVTPGLCREIIEGLDCIGQRFEGNNVIRYIADFEGVPVEIRSTPTRTILFCPNRYALSEFEKLLDIPSWEYDNATRLDYVKSGNM